MHNSPPSPRTLGELRATGYRQRSLKAELLENVQSRLREGRPLFEGILGYDETVMPAVENALLCGHDLIFLGERGQAKTRMIRSLTGLLDEWIPEVAGSEIHVLRGSLQAQTGDNAGALLSLETALAADPSDPRLRPQLVERWGEENTVA